MSSDFSRTLSLLRKEKNVSQRVAADALGISQALLSHYENGIREPGLAFVVKACDYYQVSADYLLGRTLSKDGAIIDAQELYDVSEHKDNVLRGSVLAMLNKKLLVNALTVIYGILGKLGNRELIAATSEYLSCALYMLFRQLYSSNDQNPTGFFAVEESLFHAGGVHNTMASNGIRVALEIEKLKIDKDVPSKLSIVDDKLLKREYPNLYQSLLQVLHNTDSAVNVNFGREVPEKKKRK